MSIWQSEVSLDEVNKSAMDSSSGHVGIEFIEYGDDYIVARMPVDHRTKQSGGILNGGASCLLAETVGSHASALCLDMEKVQCVGLDINANHIRSVSEGFVYGTGRPIHLGRSTHIWEIIIRDEQERLVCISRLTMMVKAH
jgi:1,4-dihydroxy-2-naphthoyl-CoA hydrolase